MVFVQLEQQSGSQFKQLEFSPKSKLLIKNNSLNENNVSKCAVEFLKKISFLTELWPMFLISYHEKSLPLSLKVSCDKPKTIYGLNCSHLFKTWTIRGKRPPLTQEPLKSRFGSSIHIFSDWGSGRRGKVDVNWGVIEVNTGWQKRGGVKKELKNCLTSFVNVPIHTPILGKTQSIRKIYI